MELHAEHVVALNDRRERSTVRHARRCLCRHGSRERMREVDVRALRDVIRTRVSELIAVHGWQAEG